MDAMRKYSLCVARRPRGLPRRYDPDQAPTVSGPLSRFFELPVALPEHSHLAFIALLMQVGPLCGPSAQPQCRGPGDARRRKWRFAKAAPTMNVIQMGKIDEPGRVSSHTLIG